jgi:transcriptional regulator with XRE-family HTH domain
VPCPGSRDAGDGGPHGIGAAGYQVDGVLAREHPVEAALCADRAVRLPPHDETLSDLLAGWPPGRLASTSRKTGGFTDPRRKCLDLRECEYRTPIGHVLDTRRFAQTVSLGIRPIQAPDRPDLGTRRTAFCGYTVKRVEHESPPGRTATPEEIAGRQLALLREERGWSQSEVARRMEASGYNWHQTTVGRIESGKRPLRLNELVHLAAMFGVSPIRLIVPNVTPDRLSDDIKAVEDARSDIVGRLEEARDQLEDASTSRSGVEETYQRLLQDIQQLDMRIAALRGLQDILAKQGEEDA